MLSLKQAAGFLKEVKVEMGKVSWPTRRETVRFTTIVIGISLAVALFLGALDFVFNSALRLII